MPYHGAFHTSRVIDRVGRILRAIQAADPSLVSDRDLQLGTIAASFHDVVQQWGENKVGIEDMPALIMNRKTGLNERASALMAKNHMLRINEREGAELFTSDDMDVVSEAIVGTIPGYDVRLGTVVQPNVDNASSLIAKAVALADLGGPGMDGPDVYLHEGSALFRELNLDLRFRCDRGVPLPHAYEEATKQRALLWSSSQAVFAQGRIARFQTVELNWLPEHVRGAVEVEFGLYSESVAAAEAAAESRATMSCEEILSDMGFNE